MYIIPCKPADITTSVWFSVTVHHRSHFTELTSVSVCVCESVECLWTLFVCKFVLKFLPCHFDFFPPPSPSLLDSFSKCYVTPRSKSDDLHRTHTDPSPCLRTNHCCFFFQMCSYVNSTGAMGASVLCWAWVWPGADKPVLKWNPPSQCSLNCLVLFQGSIAAAQIVRSLCVQQHTWYLLIWVPLYQKCQMLTASHNLWTSTTGYPAAVSPLCPRAISCSFQHVWGGFVLADT